MSERENQSEVARLMQEIELAYEAAQLALTGLAITARHDFINARQEHIAMCHEDLKKLVGEDQAIKIIYETQVKVMGE
jgi:hypothetical protein